LKSGSINTSLNIFFNIGVPCSFCSFIAGDSSCPERRIPADPGKHHWDVLLFIQG